MIDGERVRRVHEAVAGGQASTGRGDEVDAQPTERPERPSLITAIVELARQRCELWHDGDDGYATVEIGPIETGTHREHYRLSGRPFRTWLARTVYLEMGRAASDTTIRDACSSLAGIAMFDGDDHTAHVRVAGVSDRIHLDLCDPAWRSIEITAEGWRVLAQPRVRFTRRGAMRALPLPVVGGALAELREHIRVTDESWPLVAGWLVGALMSRGPYPVLVLRGTHGTGKSHTARVLRDLVDPSTAPIRSEPREPRDLVVAALGSWVVALDNISSLPSWLSDGLCRLATGGGYAARQLYTDNDEVVIDVQRPVILTGITDIVTAPDLLDRALLVELEPMPDGMRKTERDLIEAWGNARPRIFGALLDAASCALRRRKSITIAKLPRLADWALTATAAEPMLGLSDGAVLRALSTTHTDAVEIALEASPIVAPLRTLVDPDPEWTGTAADLLRELVCRSDEASRNDRTWPRTPRGLAAALARLIPSLASVGILVERLQRAHGGARRWRVSARRGEFGPSPSSPPCSGVRGDDEHGDDGDGCSAASARDGAAR